MLLLRTYAFATARKMSAAANQGKHLIAVCQLTSVHDLEKNFETARRMVEHAADRQCKMVFFPECFDYVGRTRDENVELAMATDCDYMQQYRDLAKKHKLWLSLGGLHHKDPNDSKRPWNTHLIIDEDGKTRAEYKKLHLFDLEIPGQVRLIESEFSKAGTQV
ncbi:unnamed protein product [Caenorhabditis auriculariae]|uniref:CN hydrolase domain-containing protein n=1 Tax=Caenorhabditis auriculariae TaxID=2777116 RepID=A0A8S1HNC1_9PELO|nr:unnamed protein product [Caenorhabditis auriculariae]